MKTKICTKCHVKKGVTLFTKDSTKKDGYYSSCKDCYRLRIGSVKRIKREKNTVHGVVRWCGRCKKYKMLSTFGSNRYYADNKHIQCKSCSILDTQREIYKLNKRGRRQEQRFTVLKYYSDGKLECKCCKENMYEFLCIDHINGIGSKERRLQGNVYNWAIKNNFPKNVFQVLCHNCNMSKGFYGKCPHQNI